MTHNITKEEVLKYHKGGKTGVTITKPCDTAHELSMAYTPGVADPCLEIKSDPSLAYSYTNKANLAKVAVEDGVAQIDSFDYCKHRAKLAAEIGLVLNSIIDFFL